LKVHKVFIKKELPKIVSAFVVSVLVLTVIQVPFGLSALAWVGLVPFILACSPEVKRLHLFIAAYLVSLFYWLGNLYWIAPVTLNGWIAFCIYTALLWPILGLGVRFCRAKKVPLFLGVAILVVGAERLQGLFLGGFFWRHLSHSQYANITLIQISDIFGAAGVSFVVAMVNGLIAELILCGREKNSFKISNSNLVKIALVCAVIGGTVIYGRWRINQSGDFIEVGPAVAAVQSNIPQSVKQSSELEDSQRIFDELVQNSNAGFDAGAELTVWPETMVQAMLDARVLRIVDSSSYYKVFDASLREHSKGRGFVLVGSYGGNPEISPNGEIELERYNSAFLYQPDGRQASEQYDKIHLVPFGEVVPFKKSVPWLYNLLMKFTPYDYDYSLDYGEEYTVFEMAGGGVRGEQIYRFGVMICYEDVIPVIGRRFAIDGQGSKRVDWLVNISNDGWFVKFKEGKVRPSTELGQHTAICVFRAVENRLAVVRSVNTGISCLIDSFGRIKDGFLAGNLPGEAMNRKGMAGWFVDKVPIDKRITVFSKTGQWLDFFCAACFILFIISPILHRFYRTLFIKSVNNRGRPNERNVG
jgi:apolipoprotein N-acyltransferase